MSIAQLTAEKRDGKPEKIRDAGFIPGVVYGKEVKENLIVKFKYSDVSEIIRKHGERAKLNAVVDGKKHLAFIKEVQKNRISNRIIHLDIQCVSSTDVIKAKVPVIYEGISELENKKLILEVSRQEIELTGNIDKIPESIKLNVAGMEAGTQITCGDLNLDKSVKTHNSNEVLASVHKMKEVIEEAPAAEEAAEATEENK